MDKAKRSDKFSVIILFFLYPFGSVPLLIRDILRLKQYAIFLLSIFMGLLGYLIVPLDNDDLTRHYETFLFIAENDWSMFFGYIKENVDFSLYLFMYLLSAFNLPKELLPFTSVFVGYFLKLSIFFHFMKNFAQEHLKKRHLFFIFLCITFFSTPFRNFALHIRNFVAVAFIIYGVYLLFIQNSKKGWFYIVLASTIHFMVILLIPFILLARKGIFRNLYRKVFFLSFLFWLLPTNYITSHITSINIDNEKFEQKQNVYAEGYYVSKYLEDVSFKGQIATIINQIPVYLVFIYLFLFNGKSALRDLMYLVAIFTNFFFSTPMIFGRYSYILVSLFFLLILYEYSISSRGKMRKHFLYLLLCVTLLTSFSRFYSTRAQILKGDTKILYNSFPTIFFNSVDKRDYIKNENSAF